MKKIKFILPVVAFVFAIALSFASANMEGPRDEGEFIQLEDPQVCQEIEPQCGTTGALCTLSTGQQIYKLRDGTVCSEPLYKD